MIAVKVLFALKPEIKKQFSDKKTVKSHLSKMVELYKNVPGLKEKYFVMVPDTLVQGAFLIWEKPEDLDNYLKSELWQTAVISISEGKPEIESYLVSASLRDGVVLE
jgi:hypothetical protein